MGKNMLKVDHCSLAHVLKKLQAVWWSPYVRHGQTTALGPHLFAFNAGVTNAVPVGSRLDIQDLISFNRPALTESQECQN